MVNSTKNARADGPCSATDPHVRVSPPSWRTTRVSKTLWPPQAGTKRLSGRYGGAVVCVRYRHDLSQSMRYTTVELVVDSGPVRTQRDRLFDCELDAPPDTGPGGTAAALAEAGARWDEATQVWRLTHAMAQRLGLASRVRRVDAGVRRAR